MSEMGGAGNNALAGVVCPPLASRLLGLRGAQKRFIATGVVNSPAWDAGVKAHGVEACKNFFRSDRRPRVVERVAFEPGHGLAGRDIKYRRIRG
ncbi:MAG: hypothetical protein AAFR75_10865 [Pseudomonadota bacterium]